MSEKLFKAVARVKTNWTWKLSRHSTMLFHLNLKHLTMFGWKFDNFIVLFFTAFYHIVSTSLIGPDKKFTGKTWQYHCNYLTSQPCPADILMKINPQNKTPRLPEIIQSEYCPDRIISTFCLSEALMCEQLKVVRNRWSHFRCRACSIALFQRCNTIKWFPGILGGTVWHDCIGIQCWNAPS